MTVQHFAVAPLRDLGPNLAAAIRQLGGDPSRGHARAHGFVEVRGDRHWRVPAPSETVHAERLGEAVAMVNDQVIYRELPTDRSELEKRIDPRTPEGFLRIVNQVRRALARTTRETEADAVRRAIDRLDVDWPNLSVQARGQVVRAANQALVDVPEVVMPEVQEVLSVEANRVVTGTRSSARRQFGFRIGSSLSQMDERAVRFVAASQTNFIRDEFGRRQRGLSRLARRVVSDGLSKGLGRDEIARDLEAAFTSTVVRRNRAYWDLVASAFVNRARSLAELNAYEEAGVQKYVISAVLDEATTDVCRFLDGKTFSVGKSMDQFRRAERLRNPDRIKSTQPWLRVRQDDQGNRGIFFPDGDSSVRLALVEESAELRGLRDDRGRFRNEVDADRLQELGVGTPPYHGLCRTTTLPVLS